MLRNTGRKGWVLRHSCLKTAVHWPCIQLHRHKAGALSVRLEKELGRKMQNVVRCLVDLLVALVGMSQPVLDGSR